MFDSRIQSAVVPAEYVFAENTGSTLFVFGNGLDINLGFPTKYEDFFLSDYFPFVMHDPYCHALGHFVFEKGLLDKWYNLEDILAEYGSSVGTQTDEEIAGDKFDYQNLIQGLENYLDSIDITTPQKDSIAANVLRAADDPLLPPVIYTFNYTDFDAISRSLGIGYSNAHYVHGSLKNKDIVLGVGEYVKLCPNVSYLHKTSSHGYDTHGILDAFEAYDIIIIFGLSLSKVDYPYFEDFFRDVASRKYMGDKKKYIRIFTYDEKARLGILDNLRGMNSGLIKLRGYSDFDIIRTKDDVDHVKVQDVINHLKVRAKLDV